VGSITHCEGFCGAVAAQLNDLAAIGFDVEASVKMKPEITALICTERELASAGEQILGEADPALIIFSAKEAFYKAWYTLTQVYLDFKDVLIVIDTSNAHGGTYSIRLNAVEHPFSELATTVSGTWMLDSERVYCGAFVSPELQR